MSESLGYPSVSHMPPGQKGSPVTQVHTRIRPHISDKGQDDGDMTLSRASDGHLESPGNKDHDNKLGTVAQTSNPSLGTWMQEDKKLLIKNCCTRLSKTLKSDVTGEEGLGQDSHSPSAH